MKIKIQKLIKALLNLHKELLGIERERYESKNGKITDSNNFFNLVVNNEDFKWLRSLSSIISLIDEESEQDNIDQKKIKKLLNELNEMLSGKIETFFLKYKVELLENEKIAKLNNLVKKEIENIRF